MGLFKKIADGFRGAGRMIKKLVDGGKTIFGKTIPKAKTLIDGAKGFYDGYNKYVPKVIDKTKELIDVMPDSKAKQKLQDLTDKGENAYRRSTDFVDNTIRRVQPYARTVKEVTNRIQDIQHQGRHIM